MIEKRYCLTPEEWAYAKAELVLAEKLGLIENAGIEALEKRCAEKNEENARLEMEKKVFYGPRRYSLPMYLQYELTRFRLDFVQPTENIRKSGISPEITENQKKAFYERNKDLFGRYFGDLFSYEEVEQIIEKRLREEVEPYLKEMSNSRGTTTDYRRLLCAYDYVKYSDYDSSERFN